MDARWEQRERERHLRVSILLFVAWFAIFLVEIRYLKQAGFRSVLDFVDGGPLPLILAVASIILFALALRRLFLYLQLGVAGKDRRS